MFAIVRAGGKQYRVAAGDKIVVARMDGEAGDTVTLGDVLLAGDGGSLKSAAGLTVSAEIVAQAKGEKVTVFKKKRRHNYRRKRGHRQLHTILKIVSVGDDKGKKADKATDQAKPEPKAPEKAEPKAARSEAPVKSEPTASEMVDAPKATTKPAKKPAEAKKPAAAKKPKSTAKPASAKAPAKKK